MILPCNKQQATQTINLVAVVSVAVAVTMAVTVTAAFVVTVAVTVAVIVIVTVPMVMPLFLDNEMPAVSPQLIQTDIITQRFLNGSGSPSHKHFVFLYLLITR